MTVTNLKYYRPLCHTEEGLLLYRSEKLYLLPDPQQAPVFFCELPIQDPRRKFCVTPFMERMMHIEVYCGAEVPGGAVIAFNRGIYFVDLANRTVRREHDFGPSDMRRPLSFHEIRGVKGFADSVVYGEYCYNAAQAPISVFARTAAGTWQNMYTFPEHTVRHIHSIISDPYRDRVIICTGDHGEEAAIWAAYDGFARVEKIFGGDQDYRACCARAYPEGLLLVTDSPYFQNYAYLLTEGPEGISRKNLFEVPGPTVFFTDYKDEVVFSTDVEYDERRLNPFTKYFTYHRGPGVQDWYSHVIMGNPQKGFREIARFRKDRYPMGSAFGFGGVDFPNGQWDGRLYLYPYSVQHDRRLCYLDLPD